MTAILDQHTKNAADRFDHWADNYGEDRISPWFRYYQSIAMADLDITPKKTFLDVGCGHGWAVRRARKIYGAGKSVGIDISAKMIEKAKSRTPEGEGFQFLLAGADSIPCPGDEFDAILCTCSFHHYQKPVKVLSEMRRVLRKGGRLALLDPARDVSLAIWFQDRFRRYLEESHVTYYTTKEIMELIIKTGFKPVKRITTYKRFWDHKKIFTGLFLAECEK